MTLDPTKGSDGVRFDDPLASAVGVGQEAPSPSPSSARASAVLARLAGRSEGRFAVSEILDALGDQSFAALALLLGLPNCVPMPPPIPTFCALLLILAALQIGLGRRSPWLPSAILRRSIAASDVARAVERSLPLVRSLESWSRRRLPLFEGRIGAILQGLLLATLALGVLTAAPVLGQIPFGLAVCLVGLGMIENDGLLIMAGAFIGLLGFLLSAGFVLVALAAIKNLF